MTRSPAYGAWAGLAGLGLGIAALVACPEAADDRRDEVAQTVAERVMRPDLGQAQARAVELHEAARSLCQAPDASGLDAAQAAWWSLREPWRRLRAVPLGPLLDEGFDSAIDFWPARPNSIEGAIEAGVSDQATLDSFGVASKGLPALEYLLWDPAAGDPAILAQLTAADSGASRCAYVEVLAADLELRFAELDAAGGVYADALADAGESATFPTASLAIDTVLNALIAGLHDLSERSMAKPLGLPSQTGVDPGLLESRFSDRSRVDVLDALEAVRRVYLGVDGGAGLGVLVGQASPEIDAAVIAELARAGAMAQALPDPLRTAMDVDPAAVAAAWDAVRELRRLLTADVAGLLGVTVSLSDNDGD